MLVPLKYNLRSLRRRWASAALTTGGIALVTAVFVGLMALSAGMALTIVATGHPRNFVVMRDGPTTETQSSLEREDAKTLETLDGVSRVSPELVVVASGTKPDGGHANVLVRGAKAAARDVREGIDVASGRWFEEGKAQAMVGAALARRMPNLGIGGKVKYRVVEWTIVGVLDSQGRAYDSEVWVDLDELEAATGRPLSSAIVRTSDAAAFTAALAADARTKHMKAHGERDYFAQQMDGAEALGFAASFITVVLGLGAVFGAANTMYAFVASRVREVATLRVLGFSRLGIFLGFVLESLAIAVPGGVLGTLLAWAVTAWLGTTGTTNWQTFTEIAFNFRVTPSVAGVGVAIAAALGLLGGLFPALRASRLPIARALREL